MSLDGLDGGVVKHFLVFNSDTTGRVEIVEPVGFDGADFTFKQDKGRYGRDVSFAGGEIEFTFYRDVNYRGITHQFNNLIDYRDSYGYESDVQYIIQYDGTDHIVGQLDFEAATTDNYEYFTCKVIQDQLEAVIKRNKDVNVNLIADRDVNGDAITPIDFDNILVKATPLTVVSEWSRIGEFNVLLLTENHLSFTPVINRSEIEDTLSPAEFRLGNAPTRLDETNFIRANNNIDNVVVDISNFTYYQTDGNGNQITDPTNQSNLSLKYRIGLEFDTAPETNVVLPISANNYNQTLNVGNLSRDQKLWIYFKKFRSGNSNEVSFVVESCDITIKAVSTAIDSTSNSVRIIDAMQQVVKSISGATVDAPEFEQGGNLYANYLILGNQLRNIDVESFDISLQDILDGIKEFDADYEVQPDGSVYFGTRDTFYNNVNLDTFTLHPSKAFAKATNPRYAINTFSFGYNKYEKGQNESLENSREGIHTEAQYKLPNKRVINSKDVKCPWTRDPFMIEKVRRQGLKVSDETSQENDDDIFIVEVVNETGQIPRSESFVANHVVSNTTVLEIINDGSFNWSLSGISVNDIITLSGENPGTYSVGSIGQSNLQLIPVSPTPNPTFEGLAYTTIDYNITNTDLVIATNQDFQLVQGTTVDEGFANMSYSIARNIRNFFGSYLRAASTFYPNGSILNTLFKYNSDFLSQKDNETQVLIEGDDIDINNLNNAILSTQLTETEVICTYSRFRTLVNAMRAQRGYVTVIDHNNNEIKTYPQELTFNWKDHKLIIKGEDRVN